jgi:hypothetical protein
MVQKLKTSRNREHASTVEHSCKHVMITVDTALYILSHPKSGQYMLGRLDIVIKRVLIANKRLRSIFPRLDNWYATAIRNSNHPITTSEERRLEAIRHQLSHLTLFQPLKPSPPPSSSPPTHPPPNGKSPRATYPTHHSPYPSS